MKCHYVYDKIAGKVLIPGCWPVVHSNDIEDCTCGYGDGEMTFAQFQRERYNEEINKRNSIIKDLREEVEYLHKELERHVDLLSKKNQMKAISIKQPWASLIAHGIKDIENRTWKCPKKYIGQRVLIHASATPVNMRNPSSVFTHQQWDFLTEEQKMLTINGAMPIGSIIGSVEILDCVINHPSVWAEKTENYTVGMNPKIHQDIIGEKVIYNWVLANPILYAKPIENVKGKLSFWDYPDIQEVKIECPECGSIEIAVEDFTTAPFAPLLHSCNKCGYVIMESELYLNKA